MTKVEAIKCDYCGRLFESNMYHFRVWGKIEGSTPNDVKMATGENEPFCFCDIKCLVERIDPAYTAAFK